MKADKRAQRLLDRARERIAKKSVGVGAHGQELIDAAAEAAASLSPPELQPLFDQLQADLHRAYLDRLSFYATEATALRTAAAQLPASLRAHLIEVADAFQVERGLMADLYTDKRMTLFRAETTIVAAASDALLSAIYSEEMP